MHCWLQDLSGGNLDFTLDKRRRTGKTYYARMGILKVKRLTWRKIWDRIWAEYAEDMSDEMRDLTHGLTARHREYWDSLWLDLPRNRNKKLGNFDYIFRDEETDNDA